jgi:hypothetical protein
MNTSEAKEKLLLYRGPIDDGDPQFEEALAHARRDPDLAEWMREQSSSYDTIRSKLREIEPPRDLAEKIIRERPIRFRRATQIIRKQPTSLRRSWAQIRDIFMMGARPELVGVAAAIVILAGITALWLNFSQRGRHPLAQGQEIVVKRPPVQGQEIVVKGEVLDMTCYIAHNLSGPQHAECAKTCIRKGLPVGIKGEDGKVYLLVGEKQAVNAELADYAAKTVTIRGKETMRDGFALLQVEAIRKF